MELSVVVPTFRRPDHLARCLDSLSAQSAPAAAYEVVVVDDGSGDHTPDVLRAASLPAALRSETFPSNRGPAAARNRGVELAGGRWVLFLDDDMVASPGLVGEHLRWLRAGDELLGVVGLVEWWPEMAVTKFMRWLDAGDAQFAFATMAEGPVEPPWRAFYTCNVSVARQLLVDAGGFDERFPYPAYEDTELALRLAGAGFHLDYRPSALAWHGRPITLGDFRARMVKVGEAAVLFQQIHPDLAGTVDVDGPRATGWRRLARGGVLAAGPVLRRTAFRNRYYAHAVSASFSAGVDRGRARSQAPTGSRSGSGAGAGSGSGSLAPGRRAT